MTAQVAGLSHQTSAVIALHVRQRKSLTELCERKLGLFALYLWKHSTLGASERRRGHLIVICPDNVIDLSRTRIEIPHAPECLSISCQRC